MPAGILKNIRKQLDYNGIEISERKFTGFMLAYGAGLAVAFGLAGNAIFGLEPFLVGPAAMAFFTVTVYVLLKLSSESKGKFVEGILPDALQIIASNMKSGLTTERALFVAGRPEFGPLQVELKNASKRISAGERG